MVVRHRGDAHRLAAPVTPSLPRTNERPPAQTYNRCRSYAWSAALPRVVSSTLRARMWTSPSLIASSQIERRGQWVRHTSIVSSYVREPLAIQSRRSRVSAGMATKSAYARLLSLRATWHFIELSVRQRAPQRATQGSASDAPALSHPGGRRLASPVRSTKSAANPPFWASTANVLYGQQRKHRILISGSPRFRLSPTRQGERWAP